MKRFFTRWYLLNKRLLKKPVFVLILCVIPVLIAALNAVTAHTGGIVEIALAAEAPDDPVTGQMINELSEDSGVIHFTICADAQEAAAMVRYGEADGAWIFSDDILRAVDRFVSGDKSAACIKIVEREETIALRLAREKLASVLSSDVCFSILQQAYEKQVSTDYDADRLREHFDNVLSGGELFEFRYASGEAVAEDTSSYLMLPIRGILAAAILLAGLTMAMFRVHDEEQMVFARVSRGARPAFELGYHLTGIVDVALVVLLSLFLSGNAVAPARELLSMAVYCLSCAVFAILVRRILRKAGSIAAATPLIIVIVVVVNPILFNLPFVYPLRVITPVFYYLQAAHNASYLWYGLAYFAVLASLDLLLMLLQNKRRTFG